MEVGVSQPVGFRWFRDAGGMAPSHLSPSLGPPSGRCLSFAERREIALWRRAWAYGRSRASVAERHPEAAVIVPPRCTAVPSETAETAPTQRDRHLQFIAKHGRAAWQKASGYTVRARAEAAIGRFKQVIGDGLCSRTDERRATEVNVAVHALNRMLDLGRPNFVRVA